MKPTQAMRRLPSDLFTQNDKTPDRGDSLHERDSFHSERDRSEKWAHVRRPGSDQRKWCVGIAVDTDGGKFYWTQKGGHDAGLGGIFRANIRVPQGQSAENRKDIELLYDNLPEPIDLDLDPVNRTLYWTYRGDPPRDNTVNRGPMDPEAENGKEPEILFTHLMEGIGPS
jgi:hypothetical protein